jgi:hypothetical protein
MTLQASTVATAISQLVISGLRIKDLSNIPEQVNSRDCPVMIPDVNYISNFVPLPKNLERSNGYWESTRNLNYWIFYSEAGQGRGIFEHVKGMTDLFDTIATKILSTDFSGIDVIGISLSGFGVIKEPNGDEYFGFAISIAISELVNS